MTPVPPSVPALTFTLLVPVPELGFVVTKSVPAVTVVIPAYVFAPESVSVPVPIFVNDPAGKP